MISQSLIVSPDFNGLKGNAFALSGRHRGCGDGTGRGPEGFHRHGARSNLLQIGFGQLFPGSSPLGNVQIIRGIGFQNGTARTFGYRSLLRMIHHHTQDIIIIIVHHARTAIGRSIIIFVRLLLLLLKGSSGHNTGTIGGWFGYCRWFGLVPLQHIVVVAFLRNSHIIIFHDHIFHIHAIIIFVGNIQNGRSGGHERVFAAITIIIICNQFLQIRVRR
mmetsp:Transcript_13908/g.28736  ORF Transcript_13908/g.28736 Transcript_13908/m.28736 type:complete len:218 (-) Transcript_13908:600-1253(-)